jgi:hypothetical protein
MKPRSLATLSLLLAAAAAASPALTFSSRTHARIGVGDEELVVSMVGDRLTGPNVELQWFGARLVGTYRNHDVNLRVIGDRVRGNIGEIPVNAWITRGDRNFRIRGGEGEEPIDLYADPRRVTGELGGCRFTLKMTGEKYEGRRVCEPAPWPSAMSVELPAALADQLPGRQVAVLAVLLTPVEVVASLEPVNRTLDAVFHEYGLRLADATRGGARVMHVIAGSPAALAGLKPGMIVTRAGSQDIPNARELAGTLMRIRPSDTWILRVRRPGHEGELEIHLTAPAPQPLSNTG